MVRAGGVSDVGRGRKTNEDCFIVDPDLRLFAVGDGMGGHDAGEVAARLAIEAIVEFFRSSAENTDFSWPWDVDPNLSFDGNRLRTAIHLANRQIFRTADSNDEYSGMGTTVVALLVNGSHISIGHVGDNRLYLLNDGRLAQLTDDDSWAATILAQDARLAPADIARHPMRHVLTNVLGARDQVDVHIAERELEGDDVLLLCSDGLHGALDDNAVQQVLQAVLEISRAETCCV